jgi:hypothetical protein
MFLAAAVTAAAANLPNCSWDRPGHNPFMGDVVAAVDRYRDIPPDIRARLKARMAARQYDEMVTIRRDAIVGRARYGSDIRDMHFGQGQVCGTVTRARWTADLQERGLVYCDGGHCVLVPTVCRNVSRIQRLSPATAEGPAATGAVPGAGGQASGGGADDPAAAMADALANAPPGAGLGQLPATGNAGDSFAQAAVPARAAIWPAPARAMLPAACWRSPAWAWAVRWRSRRRWPLPRWLRSAMARPRVRPATCATTWRPMCRCRVCPASPGARVTCPCLTA